MNKKVIQLEEDNEPNTQSNLSITPTHSNNQKQTPNNKQPQQVNFDFFLNNPLDLSNSKSFNQSDHPHQQSQKDDDQSQLEIEEDKQKESQENYLDNEQNQLVILCFDACDRINRVIERKGTDQFKVEWKKRKDGSIPLIDVLSQSQIKEAKGILKLLNFYQQNYLIQGAKYLFNIDIELKNIQKSYVFG